MSRIFRCLELFSVPLRFDVTKVYCIRFYMLNDFLYYFNLNIRLGCPYSYHQIERSRTVFMLVPS